MARARLSLVTALGLLLGACSSGSGTGDGGLTAAKAVTDLATAVCTQIQSCSSGSYEITRQYGSFSNCVARQQIEQQAALTAPQGSKTPAFLEACAAAMATESCTDYRDNNPPAACIPQPGGIATGAACEFSVQCQSTFCSVPPDAGICGTCQPLPAAGAACTVAPCGRAQTCTDTDAVCSAYVGDGGSCDARNVCAGGLGCQGFDAGGGPGNCLPLGNAVGAACDTKSLTGTACDGDQGELCVDQVCTQITLVPAGSACGMADGGLLKCADGGTICIVTSQVQCQAGATCVANGGQGSCVAAAPDQEACDIAVGPGCTAPAKCVTDGGTGGTCVLPAPSSCQ